MSVQGGDRPAFRVNAWDVVAVLLNTATAMIGTVAGLCNALGNLARGQSGYVDQQREFQECASYDIEMIAGMENER